LATDLALVKQHLNIIGDEDDALLNHYIASAVERFQSNTGRALITQTLLQVADDFPRDCYYDHHVFFEVYKHQDADSQIYLERGTPLQAVLSVEYYDTEGVKQTLSTDVYGVVANAVPARIYLKKGQTFPRVEQGRPSAVEITYRAGYGDTHEDVPSDIKEALSKIIGDLYEFREDEFLARGGNLAKAHLGSKQLWNRYKVFGR
jgi:uncharacterized phiE125 gp8 family phage protein